MTQPRLTALSALLVFIFSLAAGWWLRQYFAYSLPHEDDLQLAMLGRPSFFSIGIVSNETRVHGAYYYQFLRASALLDANWVEGSAKLLVLAAAAANALLFLLAAHLGGITAGLAVVALCAISPFFHWNLLQLWNLSFLPLHYLLPIGAILAAASIERRSGRLLALAGGLLLLIPATSVHQSSLLVFLALAATFSTRQGREAFGIGLPSALALLGGFSLAYLAISSGMAAGESARLPHGSILHDLAERVLRAPRWEFAFATGPRSLLTLRHLFDAVFVLFLWINLGALRAPARDGADRFLRWLIAFSAPLACYAYAFYFTQPTHFRDRYVLLCLLALSLRAVIVWRAGYRPGQRALALYAGAVSLVAMATAWVLGVPGTGAAAAPYGLAAGALALFLLARRRYVFSFLVAALAVHSAAYFSSRHYFPQENAGAFLTLGQGRAIGGFLREAGLGNWPAISRSLVLGDFYSLVALAGIVANPSPELLTPEACRRATPSSEGVFLSPRPRPHGSCEEAFVAALAAHAPLRTLYGRQLIEPTGCLRTNGLGAYRFRWKETSLRDGLSNYGLPIRCANELPPGARAAHGPLHLFAERSAEKTTVRLEIDSAVTRYHANLSTLTNAKVTIRCGSRESTEELVPAPNASDFPLPVRRHTRDLVLSPLRWSVPNCDRGGVFRLRWDGISPTEGAGSLELALPAL